MPRFSVLDTKPSHVSDFPLTVSQQLWLLFLLPTLFSLIVYIGDIATDIALGIELISERRFLPGILTLVLVYIPPLITYVIRLSNPPETKKVRVAFVWLAVETAAFIFFPIRPIQCFAERIFWAIEAIRFDDPDREEALVEFESTRVPVVESYLFAQAFFQAGPQAILQTVLLALGTSHHRSTEIVQVACLVSSLASLALVTSSYQRYETQVRGGRHQVWASSDRSFSALLISAESEVEVNIPQRRKWLKIMDEDNPVGSTLSFLFWFLFLFGRILCLVMASLFYPWAVLGVCIAHYLFCFAYILPTPTCTSSIPSKILLAYLYIFCLIEVGIQFKKAFLFYSLFYFFSIVENVSLTLLWVIWARWSGWWYYFSLYLMGVTHFLATCFVLIYLKYFRPHIRRLEPM